jgi:Tfp pilus assembly protein PilP
LADKHFAMVEDPEQISYTIIEGEKLGNLSGIVEEIKENEIIIAEPYLDIYDQQQIRKISLKLHVEEAQGGKIK